MFETSARLLRLLSLLQSRRDWTGGELAARLGVTTRTVRRDIERLRGLGYLVEAMTGPAGGYRLGIGAALPPLLLDDTEAIAVAVGLRLAAATPVRELDEAAGAALAKLDRVLPSRLRARVEALGSATVNLTGASAEIEPQDLLVIAQAISDRERLAIGYLDHAGRRTERTLEPYRVVNTGRRWYLLARDVDRQAWRTLRLDRISDPRGTGRRFELAEEPDVAGLISAGLAVAPYRWAARIRIGAPAEEIRRRIPPSAGLVEPDGPDACLLTSGSDHLDAIIAHTLFLDRPFEVLEPPELRQRVLQLAAELIAAHDGRTDGDRGAVGPAQGQQDPPGGQPGELAGQAGGQHRGQAPGPAGSARPADQHPGDGSQDRDLTPTPGAGRRVRRHARKSGTGPA